MRTNPAIHSSIEGLLRSALFSTLFFKRRYLMPVLHVPQLWHRRPADVLFPLQSLSSCSFVFSTLRVSVPVLRTNPTPTQIMATFQNGGILPRNPAVFLKTDGNLRVNSHFSLLKNSRFSPKIRTYITMIFAKKYRPPLRIYIPQLTASASSVSKYGVAFVNDLNARYSRKAAGSGTGF